jgi:hypothetical protein
VAPALLLVALAGCGAPAPSPSAVQAGPVPPVASLPGTTEHRCTAADLALSLGPVTGTKQQRTLSLTFTNTSALPCDLHGTPGVDLHGPDDPNGPVYRLRRPADDGSQSHLELAPGAGAAAPLTYQPWIPLSAGANGSTDWVPTQVVVTPPGDTATLTAPWTPADPVMREDPAVYPATFVGAIGRA